MEIEINKLNKNKNISTGRTTAMKLDEHSQAMIFKLFTGGLYSDPIGTVIREITSNCFDAHDEAKIDPTEIPVIVKLGQDAGGHYMSFIDQGIGMSPTRVEKIYGVYFASTKRGTNTQIGGFGLGGKTPLAYTESFYVTTISTKEAELEFCENSIIDILLNQLPTADSEEERLHLQVELQYFTQRYKKSRKIINRNVKYVYDIFEDENQPSKDLMEMFGTDEPTGTTVKVPIESSDVHDFQRKTLRQLYYFENVIFEGFTSHVTNDYEIIKGKNFLYRGHDYGDTMHACYGKVAYPLDYDALGLNQYDYDLPIAIRLEIGDLEGTGVTPPRESLQYSNANIKIIKKKIDAAILELKSMLEKQYSNVVSLKDYYNVIEHRTILHLNDHRSINLGTMISFDDISLSNFKYKDLTIPNAHELFSTLYNNHRYGRAGVNYSRKYNRSWSGDFDKMTSFDNLYYNEGEFNRDVKKQGYLKWLSSTDNFFIIHNEKLTPYQFDKLISIFGLAKIDHLTGTSLYNEKNIQRGIVYDMRFNIAEKKAVKITKQFLDEFDQIVKERTSGNYDTIEISQEYLDDKKKGVTKKKIYEQGIPLKCFCSTYGRRPTDRHKLEKLKNFKGRIFYGFSEDEFQLEKLSQAMESMGYENYKTKAHRLKQHDKGILIVRIAHSNEKYIKLLGKKAVHVDNFEKVFLSRKIDQLVKTIYATKIRYVLNEEVSEVLKKENIIQHVDQNIFKSLQKIQGYMYSSMKVNFGYLNCHKLKMIYGLPMEDDIKWEDSPVAKDIEKLVNITNKAGNKLTWLRLPWDINKTQEDHMELISLIKMMIK